MLFAAGEPRQLSQCLSGVWRLADPAIGARRGHRGGGTGSEGGSSRGRGCQVLRSERRVFLEAFARASDQKLPWVESSHGRASATLRRVARRLRRRGDGASRAPGDGGVRKRSLTPGLQQVRSVEERENVALLGLTCARLRHGQKATDDVDRATGAMEQARRRAGEHEPCVRSQS